ncbi:MAG: hypothetical protein GY950_34825 [bacterium]|nr:hypothetical protein [bacterium]
MSDSYRICLIRPENNPHSLCFREVGLLLVSALMSNGLECDLTLNQLDPGKINVVLGYHLLTFEPGLKDYRYIPYQLEQLHSHEYPFTENMEMVLKHAYDVWDYSKKNISFLKEKGIAAKHLVPGYHQNLELIEPAPNRGVDILFYGSIGDRRKVILEELAPLFKVKALSGVYGEKRDKWIARSKIILNLHHYSLQIFEAVRISYLLNNRCLVVSENSVNYPYKEVNLPLVSYDNLVETCALFLKEPERMERVRNENHERFKKNYPMTELIRKVI